MAKRGRPSKYSEKIADEICKRLEQGESLNRICMDDHLPQEPTVRNWALQDTQGFFAKYVRARTIQAHHMAEAVLGISDDGSNDTYRDEDGNARTDYDVIARSKLRIDTRKWYLSKVLPKVYGDKVAMEHSGRIDTGVLSAPPEEVDPELWDQMAKRGAVSKNGDAGNGKH